MNRASGQSGSVLLAALAVLGILATTVSGILLYGSWQRARCFLALEEVKASYLAETGIQQAAAQLATNPNFRAQNLTVDLDSKSRFVYSISPWGGFLKVTATGQADRVQRSMSALIGQSPPEIFDNAITQIGKPFPLVVSGATLIRGRVVVAAAGVTRGEVNGRGFVGDSPIDGEIVERDLRSLPHSSDEVLAEFIDTLNHWRAATANRSDYSLSYEVARDLTGDRVQGSSPMRTSASIAFDLTDSVAVGCDLVFFADCSIIVRGKTHLNRAILCAENNIIIEGESRLSDCIVVARRIEFREFAQFDGQVFAGDTVTVSGSAALSRLSFVYLRGSAVGSRIEGLATFESTVPSSAFVFAGAGKCSVAPESTYENCSRLMIGRASQLRGLVWTEGYMEPLGPFSGSAAVSLFRFYEEPTTYQNWLVDAQIYFATTAEDAVIPLLFPVNARVRMRDVRSEEQ